MFHIKIRHMGNSTVVSTSAEMLLELDKNRMPRSGDNGLIFLAHDPAALAPKAKLKADTAAGTIELDSETTLSGIPPECWAYKLGNRSGLEWVLDQYKEKTPRDPTVAAKFNTYRFADYKDQVIDLLGRVAHVSVETMKVTEAMKALKRE